MNRILHRTAIAVSACALLSACGDPLARVDKLSSVDLSPDATTVEIAPSAEKAAPEGGFFAGLFARRDAVQTAPDQPRAEPNLAVREALQDGGAALDAADADGTKVALAPQEPQRRGLLALLGGARARDRAQSDGVKTASLGPVSTTPEAPKSAGLFGSQTRAHKGPDAQIVAFGTVLPPGVVARVCDLPGGRLGTDVGRFPERGRGYRLYDSAPSSGGARPFYVTGFDDNCARTFTAAMAMFGSPTMHEQLRYGLPSSVQPYSTTDKAYEGIKQAVCGVGRKKACGAKIGQLEKDTAFISIYDRLGSNAQWSNILLHKGWVLAADRKG